MPDSVKLGLVAAGGSANMVPIGLSADVRTAPLGSASAVASACGGGGFAGYLGSRVDFAPEAIPAYAPFPLSDDGWIPDSDIGFDFSFYGVTYSKVNIYMNGFLLFGPAPPKNQSGSAVGGFIPANINPKNFIALAWTDWAPHKTTDGIRYETRGTAPHRKFIVQYNNVPELSGNGRLMAQVVLNEGSNEITIYSNAMSVTNSMHFVTQGIQDLSGTQAMWDSVQNSVTGAWSKRVHNFFSLKNDAIRFSLIATKDEVAPTINTPVNLRHDNDPGLATAVVEVAPPAAQDNCTAVTMTGVRSDAKSLDAPYPVGVTTITWTGTDASGNAASVQQLVTVIDVEAPTLAVEDMIVNATTRNGAVVNYALAPHDNVAVTSVVCDKLSGSLFPIGERMVTCIASDAAGNAYTTSFNVLVLNAPAQMENLMAYLLGLNLPEGAKNPLVNQLRASYDGNNSCKKMSDFISMVSKKGRDLPLGSGPYMTNEATRIMVVMGCANAPSRASLFNPALLGN